MLVNLFTPTTTRSPASICWATREHRAWQRRIDDLTKAAAGSGNVLVPLREALRARATVGEVCATLREVWGSYHPADAA